MTDIKLPELVGTLAGLPESLVSTIRVYGEACYRVGEKSEFWQEAAEKQCAQVYELQEEIKQLKACIPPNEQGKNRYGLDMAYFRNLINRELNRPLVDFKPDELARVLARASRTADPDVMHEPEFARTGGEVEARLEVLDRIRATIGIGSKVEDRCLITSIKNMLRFSEYLHAIEQEFFMVPGEPDEDFPEDGPEDVCLLNCWGSTKDQYIKDFKAAMDSLYTRPTPAAAVPGEWRETIALAAGHLGDWLDARECECEMGHICGRPNVEQTRQRLLDMLTAAPQPVGESEYVCHKCLKPVAGPEPFKAHVWCTDCHVNTSASIAQDLAQPPEGER